jgi:hypothetical protein
MSTSKFDNYLKLAGLLVCFRVKRSHLHITEAVSTCIAQSITENENFVGNVSTKLSSLTDFKASIARAISEDVKQQVYESLSFDVSSANEKIEERKSLERNLADKCGKLQDNLDELEQYGRRNCLLIHGVPEKQTKLQTTKF